MNLDTAFLLSAQRHAQKTAVYWGEDQLSYGQIQQAMRQTAFHLRERLAVAPGDRVGIWMRNRPEYFSALLGTLRQGAVAVPINHFLKPPEVAHLLEDGGIRVLISERAFEPQVQVLRERFPTLQALWLDHENLDMPGSADPLGPSSHSEDDLAVIIYTSGTTGRPKGAMLTHGNLLHNVESCRKMLSAVDHDQFALLLPMFHSFMLCVCIFLPLIVGGSVVLIKSLHPPKNVILEILQRKPTILPAIPQFFRALTDPSVPAQLPVRLCVSGAAPLPRQILKEFNAKFPIPLLEGYGLSEASPVVSMNPVSGPWKAGSIGVPIPDVEVSIQDEQGKVLPPHSVGEICVRGGNVMKGYWNLPDETAQVLRGGWLLTGDVGYVDEDGYFFITDRKKDMLLVNGINVYPREIEEVLYQFPGVKEAAVVGQSDARRGEQPIAFVSSGSEDRLDEKAILNFARERLADYKVPRQVIQIPALPRNDTGKVLKTALRKMLADTGTEG